MLARAGRQISGVDLRHERAMVWDVVCRKPAVDRPIPPKESCFGGIITGFRAGGSRRLRQIGGLAGLCHEDQRMTTKPTPRALLDGLFRTAIAAAHPSS